MILTVVDFGHDNHPLKLHWHQRGWEGGGAQSGGFVQALLGTLAGRGV